MHLKLHYDGSKLYSYEWSRVIPLYRLHYYVRQEGYTFEVVNKNGKDLTKKYLCKLASMQLKDYSSDDLYFMIKK